LFGFACLLIPGLLFGYVYAVTIWFPYITFFSTLFTYILECLKTFFNDQNRFILRTSNISRHLFPEIGRLTATEYLTPTSLQVDSANYVNNWRILGLAIIDDENTLQPSIHYFISNSYPKIRLVFIHILLTVFWNWVINPTLHKWLDDSVPFNPTTIII